MGKVKGSLLMLLGCTFQSKPFVRLYLKCDETNIFDIMLNLKIVVFFFLNSSTNSPKC